MSLRLFPILALLAFSITLGFASQCSAQGTGMGGGEDLPSHYDYRYHHLMDVTYSPRRTVGIFNEVYGATITATARSYMDKVDNNEVATLRAYYEGSNNNTIVRRLKRVLESGAASAGWQPLAGTTGFKFVNFPAGGEVPYFDIDTVTVVLDHFDTAGRSCPLRMVDPDPEKSHRNYVASISLTHPIHEHAMMNTDWVLGNPGDAERKVCVQVDYMNEYDDMKLTVYWYDKANKAWYVFNNTLEAPLLATGDSSGLRFTEATWPTAQLQNAGFHSEEDLIDFEVVLWRDAGPTPPSDPPNNDWDLDF